MEQGYKSWERVQHGVVCGKTFPSLMWNNTTTAPWNCGWEKCNKIVKGAPSAGEELFLYDRKGGIVEEEWKDGRKIEWNKWVWFRLRCLASSILAVLWLIAFRLEFFYVGLFGRIESICSINKGGPGSRSFGERFFKGPFEPHSSAIGRTWRRSGLYGSGLELI